MMFKMISTFKYIIILINTFHTCTHSAYFLANQKGTKVLAAQKETKTETIREKITFDRNFFQKSLLHRKNVESLNFNHFFYLQKKIV